MKRTKCCAPAVVAFLIVSAVTGACHAQPLMTTFLPWNPTSFVPSGIGESFDSNGTYRVVSRPFTDSGLNFRSGAVEIRAAESNSLLYTITNPRPATWDHFGGEVALSGELLAVSAEHRANLIPPQEGIVYVYDLGGPDPDEPILIIENPAPDANDNFGGRLALNGGLLAVTKLRSRSPASSVFVFDIDSETPQQPVAVIDDPRDDPDGEFGESISLEDGWLFCGSRFADATGVRSGIAYAFHIDGPAPETPVLTFEPPSSFDILFGEDVDVDGGYLVISSPGHFVNDGFGLVYLYDLASSEPTVPVRTFESGSAAGYFNFGQSISISGANCLVGEAGGAQLFEIVAEGSGPLYTFVDPVDIPNDRFGQRVSLSGRYAMVGDPMTTTQNSGNVHVYNTRSSSPQIAQATVSSDSRIGRVALGGAVAMSGDRLIAGARMDDVAAAKSGSVYIFDIVDGVPGQSIFLANPEPLPNAEFGFSVAIDGETAVVGTSGVGPEPTNAYAFDLAGPEPEIPVVTFEHPDMQRASMGKAVAVRNGIVAVASEVSPGEVFLYDLNAPDPASSFLRIGNPLSGGSGFGDSLAFQSETRLFIGAPDNTVDGIRSGVVYVYDLQADNIEPVRVVQMPSGQPFAEFGAAIDVSSDYLVVGVPGFDDTNTNSGHVYVFDLSSDDPQPPVYALPNPAPQDLSAFGEAVAIEGQTVVVGAPLGSGGAINDGVAYVFDLSSNNPQIPVGTINNPASGFADQFGTSVAISDARILVGADRDDTSGALAGAVHLFGDGPVRHTPAQFSLDRGSLSSGGLLDLHAVDQAAVVVSRNNLDVQSVIEVSACSSTTNRLPETLELRVVSRVVSKPSITQKVELYNYNTSTWECISSAIASNAGFSVLDARPSGDLSRFVEPVTGKTEARIRFSAQRDRARYSALIDQIQWSIE